MKKNRIILLVIVLAVLPIPVKQAYLFLTSSDNERNIAFTSDFKAESFNDASDGGCSVVDTFYQNSTDSSYTVVFTLDSCSQEPFAGIKFVPADDVPVDLSRYDTLSVVTQLNYVKDICIDFRTWIGGHTINTVPITHRFNNFNIACTEQPETVSIAFKKMFRTPDFWFKKDGNRAIHPESLRKETYKKVTEIVFQNTSTEIGKKTVLTISGIIVKKNIRAQKQRVLFICMSYYLLLLLAGAILVAVRKRTGKTPVARGEPKPKPEEVITDWTRIREYIETHYQNQLVIATIAGDIGLTAARITYGIKNHFGHNFRTLLNHTRMLEAQRQLRDTERTIAEVSYAVGFTNPSNFNRVFRNLYSCTPLEYRKLCAKTGSSTPLPLFPDKRKPGFLRVKK